MVEPSPKTLHPREVIGLIVANDKIDHRDFNEVTYDEDDVAKTMPLDKKKFDDVTFADKEVARILPLFQRFCKDKVTVLTNPTSKQLADYFVDVADKKAGDLRKEENGKAGCTLLFHFVGHGAFLGTYTGVWLNEAIKENHNPYPIEQKLRAFVATENSFVLGQLNCCRQTFFGSLGDNSAADASSAICLIFPKKFNTLANATGDFGERCAAELEKRFEEGQKVLKFPQTFSMGNWEKTITIMREIHLTDVSLIPMSQHVVQLAPKTNPSPVPQSAPRTNPSPVPQPDSKINPSPVQQPAPKTNPSPVPQSAPKTNPSPVPQPAPKNSQTVESLTQISYHVQQPAPKINPSPVQQVVTKINPSPVQQVVPKINPSPVQQPASQKKHIFTQTKVVAEEPREQDQEHPVKAKLNWSNPLNGVSRYDDYSYQFISLDGTRSAFDSSKRKGDNSVFFKPKWTDHIIPQGKQIRTVETLLHKQQGWLVGFKWIGDDGAVLVAVGEIDKPSYRNDTKNFVLQSLTLNHNQRIVGVKSDSYGEKLAIHTSFQWVICTEE